MELEKYAIVVNVFENLNEQIDVYLNENKELNISSI